MRLAELFDILSDLWATEAPTKSFVEAINQTELVGVPLPGFTFTEDRLTLCWETDIQTFELDLYEDSTVDWFWRNRKTEEDEGSDSPLAELPAEGFKRLRGMWRS